jgi:hypothetical protein
VESVGMLQLLFELFGDQWQADFPWLFVIFQGIRVVAVSLQVDADVERYYPQGQWVSHDWSKKYVLKYYYC